MTYIVPPTVLISSPVPASTAHADAAPLNSGGGSSTSALGASSSGAGDPSATGSSSGGSNSGGSSGSDSGGAASSSGSTGTSGGDPSTSGSGSDGSGGGNPADAQLIAQGNAAKNNRDDALRRAADDEEGISKSNGKIGADQKQITDIGLEQQTLLDQLQALQGDSTADDQMVAAYLADCSRRWMESTTPSRGFKFKSPRANLT